MIRQLFPAVLAAALGGCSDTIGPPDLHVEVEVDPTTLTAGDSTHVRVIVTNISPRTVTISADDCPHPITVYDRRDRALPGEGCIFLSPARMKYL